MSAIPGHLGPRISALLDGQLSAEETERAWEHVQTCGQCHDQVQRETWVKRQLACLSATPRQSTPSAALMGNLLDPATLAAEQHWHADRGRRTASFLAVTGSAVGAAMLGVIAVGAGPAVAPTTERRTPTTTSTSVVSNPAGGGSVRLISSTGQE